MCDDLGVLGAIVSDWVNWLAEEDAIVDIALGEVEQLGTDHHERLTPFTLYLVGLFLMNDWKHLSAADDAIHFQVGGIEVDAFLDGLFVVVGLGEALVVGLVKSVYLVPHVFAQTVDLFFCKPLGLQVASSLVFDQVFVFIRILAISSP